ncbi:restriction endonuclease subunit S [Bacillus stercoris]|uniref:restriction endonuclease subunit S n=1 Tax=Bacillus TaxID=1386 RepID=UPI00249B47A3|nr:MULTISPECIES: restriction endonuclease subunit S [Bacillus]MDN0193014.1 restriction endonuclease subunit S [Bacillus sp. B.PNR1]MDN3035014.1 restriction endonuclease subunit S [Bacillus sp. B.PNR2]WGV97728.1 restriction endonuclease subunit S [Bacillus stercoris]
MVKVMNEIKWKDFNIGGENGLFTIESSNSGIDKNKLTSLTGETPYITRTDLNNGVNLFIGDDQKSQYKKNNGNVITIGLDTQTVFYQEKPFFTGQNIQILSHEKLTKNIALFIIPLLKIQLKKFNWGGNGATLTRLNKTKIVLPSTAEGNPDWGYMENYSRKQQELKKQKMIKFLEKELNKIGEYELVKLNEVNWGTFSISDLFILKRGNQNNMSSLEEGNFPLISARKFNNGYKGFVNRNEKDSFEGKVLTINNDGDGGAGIAYYQPSEMLLDTHVTALKPIKELNEYSSLFIACSITKQRDKFGNGYPVSNNRLNAQQIILPLTENNQINFEFMENYIKRIKKNKIEKVLNFLVNNLG